MSLAFEEVCKAVEIAPKTNDKTTTGSHTTNIVIITAVRNAVAAINASTNISGPASP